MLRKRQRAWRESSEYSDADPPHHPPHNRKQGALHRRLIAASSVPMIKRSLRGTAEVSFRGLNGYMTEQELDLLQLPSQSNAPPFAVVRMGQGFTS